MSLLEKLIFSTQRSKRTGCVIVYTHAKRSTVALCQALKSAGAEVIFCPVNYSLESTRLDELRDSGVRVVETENELASYIAQADCAIEDGARVSKCIRRYAAAPKKAFFTVEQTSGGVRYFMEYKPAYPVINVAMSSLKLDIENRRATPEGVLRYFSVATDKTLAGRKVLIIGFGSIGEGLARLARAAGAYITVYDTQATKRLSARHQGYEITDSIGFDQTLSKQDVIFMATNTYQGAALSNEQLLLMKDEAVICNAGSGRGEFGLELQTPGSYLFHDAEATVREEGGHLYVTFSKQGARKTIQVLSKAFPINLHLGRGTSHDAIEVVMALLLLSLLTGPVGRKPGLQPMRDDIQEQIAHLLLEQEASRGLVPHFVKTKSLDVAHKPYGGIFAFHDELSSSANVAVIRAWFKKGSRTRGHYHRISQEAYYVEKGQADIVLWQKGCPRTTYRMVPGDYLLIPETYYHDVRVGLKSDFECLVITTPPFKVWDQFFSPLRQTEQEKIA